MSNTQTKLVLRDVKIVSGGIPWTAANNISRENHCSQNMLVFLAPYRSSSEMTALINTVAYSPK